MSLLLNIDYRWNQMGGACQGANHRGLVNAPFEFYLFYADAWFPCCETHLWEWGRHLRRTE